MKEHEEVSFGLLFVILTDHANAAKVSVLGLAYLVTFFVQSNIVSCLIASNITPYYYLLFIIFLFSRNRFCYH